MEKAEAQEQRLIHRERPILVDRESVAGIMGGYKHCTRRVILPQPPTPEQFPGSLFGLSRCVADGIRLYSQDEYERMPKHPTDWELIGSVGVARDTGFSLRWRCPYGGPGDRLWCRESYWHLGSAGHPPRTDWRPWVPTAGDGRCVAYGPEPPAMHHRPEATWRRRPGIHMPRWASRLTLEVVEVKVERVQDIELGDAMDEGIKQISKDGGRTWKYGVPDRDGLPGGCDVGWPWQAWCRSPVEAFKRRWDGINEKRGYGWERNPWVWVVRFRRVP